MRNFIHAFIVFPGKKERQSGHFLKVRSLLKVRAELGVSEFKESVTVKLSSHHGSPPSLSSVWRYRSRSVEIKYWGEIQY